MDWEIQIEKKANKSLGKIPNPYKNNIIEAIDDLGVDPRPYHTKKLKGEDDLWRIRVRITASSIRYMITRRLS